ncbi:MAG: AEC family transporter [Desulfobulbaceae bacterium]|nr:AEC family transporter [Desulfobulbaceae bacterium]
MAFWFVINETIFPLAVLLCVAFGYQKLFRGDTKQLNNLVLFVLLPVNIFHELSTKKIGFNEIGQPFLFMILLTSALLIIAFLASRLLHLSKEQQTSFILSVAMINVGNVGLSLIFFTYGSAANNIALLIFVAFNIPLTTLAIYFSSNQKNWLGAIKDVLKIPIFHATVLAILLTTLGLQTPAPIHKVTGYLGQATFPIFTFVFGMQLADVRFSREMLGTVATASFLRLVISPVLAIVILLAMGVSGLEYKVGLVQTSSPAPILPLMYAIRFNRSPELLAAIIIVTTLLSAVTLPLVIAFAQRI